MNMETLIALRLCVAPNMAPEQPSQLSNETLRHERRNSSRPFLSHRPRKWSQRHVHAASMNALIGKGLPPLLSCDLQSVHAAVPSREV